MIEEKDAQDRNAFKAQWEAPLVFTLDTVCTNGKGTTPGEGIPGGGTTFVVYGPS